jgi:hypothetical protein
MTRRRTIGLIAALLVAGPASSASAESDGDRAACHQGNLPACSRIIDDALAEARDRVAASIERGLFHRDHGDRDLAQADFQQAIALDPANNNASLSNRCLAIAKNDDKDHPVFAYGIADSRSAATGEAIFRCGLEAARKNFSPACAVAELACDGRADLPAALRPELGRPCALGERVTVSGTIQDVTRKPGGWSAGTIARVDNCRGMTDPSTGFAALFGNGRPPRGCEHGSRFFASGTARYGFEPEFFLDVQSIKCE